MSDAKPSSTHPTSRNLENPADQTAPVAVSEENLAALLRAMIGSAKPEAQRLAEGMDAASDGNESNAEAREPDADRPAAGIGQSADATESRRALFAAVKENRLTISRPLFTPATPLVDPSPTGKGNIPTRTAERYENLSVSKAAPLQVVLPERVSFVPAPTAPIGIPSGTAIGDQSDKSQRARLVIGLVIGAVIAIVGISTFVMRAHSSKTPAVAVSAPAPQTNVPQQAPVEPPLQIRVEPLGKGLMDVRWNPQSASIAQARDGRLLITESNQKPRIFALDAGQLKTGHLMYQSAAESIQIDLEVVDRSGAIVRESVLALQSPISSPQAAATPPRDQAATAKPQNIPNLQATTEAPQLSQPKIRAFVPPAAQRNPEQRVFVDAPPTLTNGPVVSPVVGLPVPQAVILPPPTKDGAVQQQVRIESSIEEANLIKKVIPTYPQIAKAARIQGTVRFTANIGKNGRILNLKFLSGPPVLVDSASAAVKQWVYRPTLLDGEPVEVITQIEVTFALH